MKKIVNYCDICKKNRTECKCDLCNKFICYGHSPSCLKSCGLSFDDEVIMGLNLCPECYKEVRRKMKQGSKRDKEFYVDIGIRLKKYFEELKLDRTKTNRKKK